MVITTLLIKPSLSQIEKELHGLASKISQDKKISDHDQKLLVKVCGLLSDLVILKKEIGIFNPQNGGVIPISFYRELRRLKCETRFNLRTFLKIKSNTARF